MGIYLGDFTQDRTVLLAVLPEDAPTGGQIQALHILSGSTLEYDYQNAWWLQLGVLSEGSFVVLWETSLRDGLSANVARKLSPETPIQTERGDRLALKLYVDGAPAPITGLSLVIEWGILGTKR